MQDSVFFLILAAFFLEPKSVRLFSDSPSPCDVWIHHLCPHLLLHVHSLVGSLHGLFVFSSTFFLVILFPVLYVCSHNPSLLRAPGWRSPLVSTMWWLVQRDRRGGLSWEGQCWGFLFILAHPYDVIIFISLGGRWPPDRFWWRLRLLRVCMLVVVFAGSPVSGGGTALQRLGSGGREKPLVNC